MENEYKKMIKSSGIVAFVQVFQMIFALIRNKGISLIVGAAGFGVWSLFQTFIEMLSSFSVFGLDQGGVREIAKSSESKELVGKTIYTFRLIILVLSVLFGILVFFFASKISIFLFGTDRFQLGVRFLSITVVFNGIARGGYAILNRVRALNKLAISQIIAAIFGSIGSILLVYIGGQDMLPVALSVVIFTLALFTTLYVRKLRIKVVRPSMPEFVNITKQLLYMGFGFTIAGLIATIMTLLSRSYLSDHYSLQSVGIYQASWTISNLYVSVLLNAMGIDFMPRLSKVANDDIKMNDMINQQINFAMTLGALGISLVILFAPFLLLLLYSNEFTTGINIVRWQILGVSLRILAFPFSYSIMAKAKPIQYAIIQILFWCGDYLLLMLFSSIWGFNALGVNYLVAYIGYLVLTYMACRYNQGFRFSSLVRNVMIQAFVFIMLFWINSYIFEGVVLYLVSIPIWLVQLWLANRHLKETMDINITQILFNRWKKIKR